LIYLGFSYYIAVTSTLKAEVNFFDLSGKKTKELIIDGSGTIHSLEFTTNGEEIAIGSTVGMVQFWNLKTLQKIREFKAIVIYSSFHVGRPQ